MTTDEKILWNKLSAFKFDDNASSFKFSHRLARENGWTISYSEKVIEEYRKFLFLCCISPNGVTPSDQVDQAWHLHLTYTKSYWVDLCRSTLAKEIHHNPTKGGKSENEKFDDYYTDTIKLYKEKFKSVPHETIWPDNNQRFSDINFQRVNLKKHWLIRRPAFKKISILFFSIIFVALFCIQAQNNGYVTLIVGIVVLGAVIYAAFNNKGGGNSNNGGCSTSGCGHSGCGHSGCSGSGCSGCGGGD